jgi:hypothetical protein
MQTVTLWRPTGPEELALLEESGWRAWPPRLPDQPIFYPVLNEDYATRIARVQQAGGQTILEYWIPAEELDEFNRHIAGMIEVVAEYH